ncbi:hypothetical protein ABL78_6966 [Leptomonas seymouri]|uniref:BAR domain-containing protein n=1 Tax=Leptomonas seymouri TaxID=5684 RepID=A0A0N1PAJ7_LEPSE|nr:hypothetical protein ABL78_6966 [Leptomonas seymouri]|eukprot:KPI83991.1 hypothetical protein ABL78_6966 [Leptomonas seymouri]
MTGAHLNPTQQLRSRQAFQSHKYLKELNEATEEAVRLHDKYFAALEKVMTCLLNNRDILEEVRQTIGPDGAAVVSTAPATTQLVSAYTNWKMSPEMDTLRGELEALRALSTEGRHTAKVTKTLSLTAEQCAKKCAYVNSPEYQAKVAHRSGAAQEKLISEARAENAKLLQLDMSLYQELKANSTWWSTKLAYRANELCSAFSRLGSRIVASFPAPMYAVAANAPMMQPMMGGAGLPPANAAAVSEMPYAYSNVPTHTTRNSFPNPSVPVSSARSEGATYSSGVPLAYHEHGSEKSVP